MLTTLRGLAHTMVLGAVLCACGEGGQTGIMLTVDADDLVRGQASVLEVIIRGEKGADVNELEPVLYGGSESIGWPRQMAIVPKDGDANRTLRVRMRAFQASSSTPFVEAQIVTGYETSRRVDLRVVLESRCIGVVCDEDETCFQGACVDAREAWQTEPMPSDGGMSDADPPPPLKWAATGAGGAHSCGLTIDGTLWCWGHGGNGRRGDGTADTDGAAPFAVVEADASAGGAAWNDWAAIALGGAHTCGLRQDGTLWCWGHGGSGRRGDATTTETDRTSPRLVLATGETAGGSGWNDWLDVTAGGTHTCGLRSGGTGWCWGGGGYGELGYGGAGVQTTPAQVKDFTDWTSLAAGGEHTCGVRSNGTLWCWGRGAHGRIGNGEAFDAAVWWLDQVLAAGAAPDGATWNDWIAVTAGEAHTCGLRSNGTLWCWGHGGSGRRGDGTLTTDRTTPSQVLAADEPAGGEAWSDWVAVAAGAQHTCGLRSNGTLWCWGAGTAGQRGDSSTSADRATPVQVVASAEAGGAPWDDWTSVSVGDSHSCGVRSDDTAWCWGARTNGRLGDGSTVGNRSTPTQVLDAVP
jgi:alpha-tubulin suppressor-like RCC1 family protein